MTRRRSATKTSFSRALRREASVTGREAAEAAGVDAVEEAAAVVAAAPPRDKESERETSY